MCSRSANMLQLTSEETMSKNSVLADEISVPVLCNDLQSRQESMSNREVQSSTEISESDSFTLDDYSDRPQENSNVCDLQQGSPSGTITKIFNTSPFNDENDQELDPPKPFLGSDSDEEYIPNPNKVGELQTDTDQVCTETSDDAWRNHAEINLEEMDIKMKKKRRNARKRTQDCDTWKKRAAALAREKGEAYTSQNNTFVPAKKPKEGILCREKCRLRCTSRFSREDRERFFADFYKIDVNAKNALLFKSIAKKPVARGKTSAAKHRSASYTYMVTKNGITEQVCKEALCALYQIGRKKVDVIKGRIQSGVSAPPMDCRGKHSNRPHRIKQEVEEHEPYEIFSCIAVELSEPKST